MSRYYYLLVLILSLAGCGTKAAGPEKTAPASSALSKTGESAHGDRTVEPLPPDMLDLVQVGETSADGVATLEAAVKPTLDADVELEVSGPPGLVFRANGKAKQRFAVRRGGEGRKERFEIDLSDGEYKKVTARLRLLNAEGEAWLILDRSIEFNKPKAEGAPERVAVVIQLPNGKSIVQYMTREEAAKAPNAKIVEPKGGEGTR